MRYDDYLQFPDPLPEPGTNYHTEGYRAFMADKLLSDNPYPLGSLQNRAWAQGWLECSAEEGEQSE